MAKKIYIWKCIDEITPYYHSSGAAVVSAHSINEAKANLVEHVADEYVDFRITVDSLADPDIIHSLDDCNISIIFPNEGCC